VSCGDLATQYADALPAAQQCDANLGGQCQKLASSSLSPCFVNCMTYVNDLSILSTIKASWLQAGCNNVPVICPAIACLQPTNDVCVVGDGGGGVCSSNVAGAAGSGGGGGGGGQGGAAGCPSIGETCGTGRSCCSGLSCCSPLPGQPSGGNVCEPACPA
jgi:hypothetical protein